MAETCEAAIGWMHLPAPEALAGSWGCPELAMVTLRAGCVHEHITERRYCARHGQLAPPDAKWFCRKCAEAGHDCPVLPQLVSHA
jgi:hypothetical protein